MDYENVWLNCDESSTSTWRNTQQHTPSYFPDTFKSTSTNHLFPNFHCHNSLECSNCINYLCQVPNDVNRNSRRYEFHPYYTYFRHTDDMQHFQLHHDIPTYNSKIKEKSYCGPTEYQQYMRIYPKVGNRENTKKINQMKYYHKKKKKQPLQKKFKEINSTYSMSQIHSSKDAEITLAENSFNSTFDIPKHETNDLSSLVDKKVSGEENLKVLNECCPDNSNFQYKIDTCECQTAANFSQANNLDNLASIMIESGLNMECDMNPYNQKPNLISSKNEDASMNQINTTEDIIMPSLMTKENSLLSTDYIYLSDELQKEVYNPHSEVQSTEQRYVEHTHTETDNFILQTLFDGKYESGKEIIVLVTGPQAHQNVTQEYSTNPVASAQNGKIDDNLNLTEGSKLQIIQGMHNTKNEGEFFISSMDDFAHEEVVETLNTASKAKKNKQNSDSCEKDTVWKELNVTEKEDKKKKCIKNNSVAEITNFKNKDFQNTHNDKIENSNLPHIRKKHKIKVNINNKRKKKTYFQQKFTGTTLKDMRNKYFYQFMRRFKLKNKTVKDDEVLQKIMKIILNKIGGNVLNSIYTTFHELIQIYNSSDNQQFLKEK